MSQNNTPTNKVAVPEGLTFDPFVDESNICDTYDLASYGINAFCLSEVYSIQLHGLMKKYKGSRELHKRLIKLINTSWKEMDKIKKETRPEIKSAKRVDTLLKNTISYSI